ncbi:MAG: anaerobic ribonucleoside-triphosphate reductase [Candidatus Hermodarchaeota archaeon]
MDLFPKVFRTEGDLAEFDSSRILESIIKETGMSESDANNITELVVRRIISSGIKFLSGPHIREIVCSILSEQHFENERKLYTRIGMPLMDYEKILENGLIEHPDRIVNPEKIHHWAANRISEEYAHLKILTNEESKAHLYGDIHIHKLRYFDLRPLSQIWDPRIILENGLPPIDNFISCCKLKLARNLKEAVHHLVKWLAITQNEFCGNQGFRYLTMFLSPYAKEVSLPKLVRIMRILIYELNHLSILTGRPIPSSSIQTSPAFLKHFIKDIVVGNQGEPTGTYGEYEEECLKLFNALLVAFKEGDDNKSPFKSPQHEILLKNVWLDDFSKVYLNVWNEIEKNKTPILINLDNPILNKKNKNGVSTNYLNSGILQEVCLNLPRLAYSAKEETRFFELLNEKLLTINQVLIKKYKIIEKRLNSNHLPLCSGKINGKDLYHLEDQSLSISFIGLNETVKFLTDFELHENVLALEFGIKILAEMNSFCEKLSQNNNLSFLLSETKSKKAVNRFAKLDLKHFPKIALPQIEGGYSYYTDSYHFKKDAEIDLIERIKKQEKLQNFIKNGAILYIPLDDLQLNNLNLVDFIKKIILPSKLTRLKFI